MLYIEYVFNKLILKTYIEQCHSKRAANGEILNMLFWVVVNMKFGSWTIGVRKR